MKCVADRSCRFIPILVLLLLLESAFAATLTPGSFDKQLVVGSIVRTYRIYVPVGYVAGNPAVFSLHGTLADGKTQETLSRLSQLADKYKFLAVYPNATGAAFVISGPGLDGEVAFVDALITELARTHAVDLRRLYVCGISNGGILTNLLASRLPGKFAAIGVVSGSITKTQQQSENPPVTPVMIFHGTSDSYVPYAGTTSLIGAEALVQWWVGKNKTATLPQIQALPDTVPTDNVTATRYSYARLTGGGDVSFYKLLNGGHTWPGNPMQPKAVLGNICLDIDASRLLWEFFSRFRRNVAPSLLSGITATPSPAQTNLPVSFVAPASDEDPVLSYLWNFGDGTSSREALPQHAYAQPGKYSATVTVADSEGGSVSAEVQVEVQERPEIKKLALSGKISPLASGAGTFTVSGKLALPEFFVPNGSSVSLKLAGAEVDFILNARGKSIANGKALTLKPDHRNPALTCFTAVAKANWPDTLLNALAEQTGQVEVQVSIVIGGQTYAARTLIHYTKSGAAVRFRN